MCQDSKNKKDVEDKDADDKKDGEGGDRKEGDEEEEAEEAVEEEEEDEDEKYKEEYRQMEHELLASCSDEEWQRYETMRCDPHLSPSMICMSRQGACVFSSFGSCASFACTRSSLRPGELSWGLKRGSKFSSMIRTPSTLGLEP